MAEEQSRSWIDLYRLALLEGASDGRLERIDKKHWVKMRWKNGEWSPIVDPPSLPSFALTG